MKLLEACCTLIWLLTAVLSPIYKSRWPGMSRTLLHMELAVCFIVSCEVVLSQSISVLTVTHNCSSKSWCSRSPKIVSCTPAHTPIESPHVTSYIPNTTNNQITVDSERLLGMPPLFLWPWPMNLRNMISSWPDYGKYLCEFLFKSI